MSDLIGIICIVVLVLFLRGMIAAMDQGQNNIDDEST